MSRSDNSLIPVQPIQAGDQEWAIYASHMGFAAFLRGAPARYEPDDRLDASSRAELQAKLTAATRRKKVRLSIPLANVQGQRGKVTGIHATNRKLRVVWPGESPEYVADYEFSGYGGFLRGDIDDSTLAQIAALSQEEKGLQAQIIVLRGRRDKIARDWRANGSTIRQAVLEASKEAQS